MKANRARAPLCAGLSLTLALALLGGAGAATTTEHASATLSPEAGTRVHGRALLTLDTRTHVLRVVVTAAGMVRGSSHPEHIHAGTCKKPGRILFGLNELHAGKNGAGRSVTAIKGVKGIAARGWIVNIHRGPALKGAGATPVACGPVVVAGSKAARTGERTQASPWVRTDRAARTVDLKVIAGYNNAGAGFNYDGYDKGAMTVTVPLGYKIVTHFENSANSELPHSFVLVPGKGSFSLVKPSPVFKNASSPDPTVGTAPGGSATVTFVASKAGTYRFVCLVPGHFEGGMWDYLVVKPGISQAFVTIH